MLKSFQGKFITFLRLIIFVFHFIRFPEDYQPIDNQDGLERRVSCHRCGNIRKRKISCIHPSCPHIFCGRCADRMQEEHGSTIFEKGCPVCLELCCCSNKSLLCTRVNHCYRKCPASKVKTFVNFDSGTLPQGLDFLAQMADVNNSKKRQRFSRSSIQYVNESINNSADDRQFQVPSPISTESSSSSENAEIRTTPFVLGPTSSLHKTAIYSSASSTSSESTSHHKILPNLPYFSHPEYINNGTIRINPNIN